jgi:hypothetical protein
MAGGVTTDDPHWRRAAAVSASLAIVAAVAASQVEGLARTACVLVGIVVALPAISTGAFALLGWLLAGLDDRSAAREPGAGTSARRSPRNRARFAAVLLAVALGAAGATWYALSPGVGSYQLSVLLMLPALVAALIWLHHRVPRRVEWGTALVLAPVGPIGYLILGGAQWWNWGQLTVLPLILLVLATARPADPGQDRPYRVFRDGPWGPP